MNNSLSLKKSLDDIARNISVQSTTTDVSSGVSMEDPSSMAYIQFFQAINFIVIATILWVLINMIAFGKRTRKWRSSSDKTKVDRGTIYIVCIIAVGSTLPRLILTQFLFYDAFYEYCEFLMDVGIVAFSLSLWLMYFFLWLRHRAIYAHPTIKQVMGQYSNCISWLLLSIVSVVSFAVMIGFVYPNDYTHGEEGCVVREKAATFWNNGANYILGGFLFVSQLNFLLLFIYPMIVTKKIRNQQQGGNQGDKDGASKGRSFGHLVTGRCSKVCKVKEMDNISSIIYRAVVSSSIAVCTDLLVAFLVAMVLPGSVSRAVTVSLYDMSLVINVFCMLANFGSNSKILCSICRKPMSRSLSSGSLNSTPKSNNKTASTEIW